MDNKIESLDEDKFLIGCVQAMASEIDDENIIENDPLSNGVLVGDIEAAALEGDKEGSIISHIRSRRSAWTAYELASLFEMNSKTIYKMAATGRIPSFRIGGTVTVRSACNGRMAGSPVPQLRPVDCVDCSLRCC